jgi:hypothetical protein
VRRKFNFPHGGGSGGIVDTLQMKLAVAMKDDCVLDQGYEAAF